MKRLHLICNAHIDPIWQWTWDEGISSALATFKSAADLAEEFDYIFCHGESLLYEAVEKNEPELFARIQRLVKIGKWKITGGWYLQPECLMPNGETIVRHISVGKKYFKEKFGIEPTVATNYDSFGHSVGLVQIMVKNGYDGYIICRPKSTKQKERPDLPPQFDYPSIFFNWKAPSGDSIRVGQTVSYRSGLGHAIERIMKRVDCHFADTDGTYTGDVDFVLWGVGNHGGGPSRKDLRDIAALDVNGVDIFHSSPENLFADDLPIGGEIDTSLVTCNPGCYSSMARVKQAYRKTENLFYGTEKMLSAAMLAGFTPDLQPLDEAEKKMLLATFHDILPGTCVEDGEREGLGLLATTEKTLRDYRTNAFLYLVMSQPCAGEGEYPIFVFNYSPQETTTQIETEFMLADQNYSLEFCYEPHVYNEAGNELPIQAIKEESTLNLDWRKKIVFEGTLKPLGITRFTVKVQAAPKVEKIVKTISSLEKTLQGNDLLPEPATLELYEDTADPWGMSMAELKAMGENPKEFRLMTCEEAGEFCAVEGGLAPIRKIEDGAIYTGIESFYTCGQTNAVLQYKCYKNSPYTDIKLTVEFADKNKLLRLKLPIPKAFSGGKAVGDGPYVWEEKPDCEMSFQKWLGIQKGEEIFAVANDGTYAGKVENGYLYLTLLRGSGYCVHPILDRELYPKDRYLPRIDCGRYVYNFRIFKGSVYEVNAMAEAFNMLPYAVNVFPTGGKKGAEIAAASRIQVDGDVQLVMAKSHEDGRIVLRVYNPARKAVRFKVWIGENCIDGEAGVGEVVSMIYQDGKFELFPDSMPV
ncbi:MAG: hypothetical protein IKA88_03105 [Clostridia bacterium]|nr:hypothetical protein [Clostridia bacterium]